MRLNRREFIAEAAWRLGWGTAGICTGTLFAPRRLDASEEAEPHYFLQIFVSGGMDSSYLFDARPLSMTAARKIQNYLEEEPKIWEGANGQRALATRLVDKLAPHRDRFSIINGVVMSTGFDGHPQNIHTMFSGNPFGGDSFIPHLNYGSGSSSLDAVLSGELAGSFRNLGKTIPLSVDAAVRLVEKNATVPALDPTNPVVAFIRKRMEENGRGAGRFSSAAKLMGRAYDESPALSQQLAGMDTSFVSGSDDAEGRFLEMMARLFERGISRSALIAFDTRIEVDTHDPASARRQPETYDKITSRLSKIFAFLSQTEVRPGRNLWDVTTVCVASEFGRTMRQGTKPIDATGTDHNPVANSVLLGGKGVRGNWVVGATDYQSATEALSSAHTSLDPLDVKAMGRPFDFERFAPRSDLPPEYRPDDYISIQSVVNSIYAVFSVDPSRYWRITRNGPAARVLAPLLVR